MTNDDKIRDEKLQYDINRKGAKISVLSTRKIVSLNIFQAKKYDLSIKVKLLNKLSLVILF